MLFQALGSESHELGSVSHQLLQHVSLHRPQVPCRAQEGAGLARGGGHLLSGAQCDGVRVYVHVCVCVVMGGDVW